MIQLNILYRNIAFFMGLEKSSAERQKFLAQALGDNSRTMVSMSLFQVQVLCGVEHSLSLPAQCRGCCSKKEEGRGRNIGRKSSILPGIVGGSLQGWNISVLQGSVLPNLGGCSLQLSLTEHLLCVWQWSCANTICPPPNNLTK